MTAKSCTIPVSVLRETPFSLPWGSTVITKVLATNSLGSSDYSQNGSGAKIITKPDAPISLTEDTTIKSPTILGISWTPPTFNGGTAITDYLINFAKSDEEFSATPIVVKNTNYEAESLTTGVSYKIRI